MRRKDLVTIKYESWQGLKRYCKCGHSMYMLDTNKKLCKLCGSYVYISPLEEFKDRFQCQLIRSRKEAIR